MAGHSRSKNGFASARLWPSEGRRTVVELIARPISGIATGLSCHPCEPRGPISAVVPAKPTGRANARPMTGSARAGIHNHRRLWSSRLEPQLGFTTNIGGYGSPRARGRRFGLISRRANVSQTHSLVTTGKSLAAHSRDPLAPRNDGSCSRHPWPKHRARTAVRAAACVCDRTVS
jgi:hypothetical protein